MKLGQWSISTRHNNCTAIKTCPQCWLTTRMRLCRGNAWVNIHKCRLTTATTWIWCKTFKTKQASIRVSSTFVRTNRLILRDPGNKSNQLKHQATSMSLKLRWQKCLIPFWRTSSTWSRWLWPTFKRWANLLQRPMSFIESETSWAKEPLAKCVSPSTNWVGTSLQ